VGAGLASGLSAPVVDLHQYTLLTKRRNIIVEGTGNLRERRYVGIFLPQ
jgi:hypothetical protein